VKTALFRGGLAGGLLAATVIGIKAMPQPPVQLSVRAQLNKSYDTGDRDALLDVYFPSQLEEPARLPTVVWVHGGSFTGGSKDGVAPYLKVLAARNFTVAGVNYALAPTKKYPTPVLQVNTALGYLIKNQAELHVDASKLFLAGDSAGAQIAAQLAIVITSASYATRMQVTPTISRSQLLGVILHCGIYDLHNSEAATQYIGSESLTNDPRLEESSVMHNITSDFPAMFISAGNADFLAPQGRLLAETARKLGITVDSLFFPDDYNPPAPHEYQFNLETEAGQLALERTTKFVTALSP
jgi:acetyl esterase